MGVDIGGTKIAVAERLCSRLSAQSIGSYSGGVSAPFDFNR